MVLCKSDSVCGTLSTLESVSVTDVFFVVVIVSMSRQHDCDNFTISTLFLYSNDLLCAKKYHSYRITIWIMFKFVNGV